MKKVHFDFSNSMEQISYEELIPQSEGIDGLNILWYANNQIDKFDKLSTTSNEERILKTDSNINRRVINSLKSSRNDYLNGGKIDQVSIKKQERKHQENQSFRSDCVLSLDQSSRNDSKHVSDSKKHETSILFSYLRKKYEKRLPTKMQNDFKYEIQIKSSITNRHEKSNLDSANNIPNCTKNEKRKYCSIQSNTSSKLLSNNQDVKKESVNIEAQLEHETSILTNYLNQFDSLTVQLIKKIKTEKI